MKKIYFALAFIGLLVLGTSCKPKQSAYKQVYEAA
ncbi:MAG TPA: SPOR domain-containing protein, partial [Porphyromonadaceae bacterium]|nr:SPOR domain-containing protein [Porphyromonadaceae bacterium]